jgi:SAM-dependent methyltransferase
MDLLEPELTRGRAVPKAENLKEDPSSMVQEQLARLDFIQTKLDFGNKSILDLGCGTGYATHYLESAGPTEMIGVDSSPASIEFARKNYPKHTFICQDVYDFDLQREFDIVMTFEVIEHVNDPQKLLNVAVKHLSGAGTLVLSTPNRLFFSLGRAKSILNKTHIHEFIDDELLTLLGKYFDSVLMYGQRHCTAGMQQAFFDDVLREEKKHLREEFICRRLGLKPPNLEDRPILRYPVRGLLNIPRWYHRVLDAQERNLFKRTASDFKFSERLDDAIWFVCICRDKK